MLFARSLWSEESERFSLEVLPAEKPDCHEADLVLRIPMRGFMPSYNLQAAMAAVASERLRQQETRS